MNKIATYCEARIYIGSRQRYNGPEFSERDLASAIGDFQTRIDESSQVAMPVRITKTSYVFGDYFEEGWEIGLINYPRKPHVSSDIFEFAAELAKHLLVKFNQNRISVVCTDTTGNLNPDQIINSYIIMFCADDAEESHK